MDVSSHFAYVTNGGSNNISMYTINSGTGKLAPIGTIGTGTEPLSLDVVGYLK